MTVLMQIHQLYRPLTATPFRTDDTYCEAAPCEALRPYIRCFWGTRMPTQESLTGCTGGLVTPDTCMDILFDLDHTQGTLSNVFCGIDDSAFLSRQNSTGNLISTFAIRFYAWAVPLFSDESMAQVQNGFFDAHRFFPVLTRQLEGMLPCADSLEERVQFAQAYLLQALREQRKKPAVLNAVYHILQKEGRAAPSEAAAYACVSPRHLERLFGELVGVSPKKLARLVRYQQVWRAVLFERGFNVQDAVHRFGFADQSHLLRDFKRFHTLTPAQARMFALHKGGGSKKEDVAFLQSNATPPVL